MSDAVYFEQIRQLVELQKVDDAIHAVKQELERAPGELNDLEQRFAAAETQRNYILDKLSHLQDQQKRLSLEIDDDSARIKKSKNKLMQVGNQREYHAMMREMDSMERVNRSREEEKTTLLEELQYQNDALAEINSTYDALKTELEEKRGGLEEKLQKGNAALEELNGKRAQVSKTIPQPVFMRYEFIRKRLEHPVIVAVKDGVCSGCHIAVPPQSFIELQRGQQILSCPNCQRLIFWCEHFAADEVPQAAAAAQDAPNAVETQEADA
ncbi:C4-type zinc ribbon domain-containing protein [uncultured Desulfovibrio sp.]|uniref:zinc ribbon domain-containing protein n=1 Tax=uncultured Desulfovibrio sp. TaxID=167968 RepID=UPI002604E2A2|nr:C4-type zinc ribbon domain-containing protein [uncultured Desulfovibrio sp.]